MSLDYLFPDHSKRNHRIAIAVETTMAVVALVFIFWAASTYWISPKKEVVAPVDPVAAQIAARKAWLEQPNTGAELLPDQVAARKTFIQSAPATSTAPKLTPEQLQARKSWVENI